MFVVLSTQPVFIWPTLFLNLRIMIHIEALRPCFVYTGNSQSWETTCLYWYLFLYLYLPESWNWDRKPDCKQRVFIIPTPVKNKYDLIFYTMRPRQNGLHFPDDTFKIIFLNENSLISIKISLKFVPKGPINSIPASVQIMAWCWPGPKPLSETMLVSLLTHICVTRLQWVNIVL